MKIIHVNVGFGSRKIAEHLAEKFRKEREKALLISLHELLPPFVNKVLFEDYKNWCQTDKNHHSLLFTKPITYQLIYTVLTLLFSLHPSWKRKGKALLFGETEVVATSFYAAFFAKLFGQKGLKIYGVLGDYEPSPGWNVGITKLFTTHPYEHKILTLSSKKKTAVVPTGMPLPLDGGSAFASSWEGKKVLITGGGWGLGKGFEAIGEILALPMVEEVLVVCGENREVQEGLTAQFSKEISNKRLQLYGVIDDMSALYNSIALIITKAGGVTVTEATHYGVPLIISSALPGHEEANCATFAEVNGITIAKSEESIKAAVAQLLSNRELAEKQVLSAKGLINSEATQCIYNVIKGLE